VPHLELLIIIGIFNQMKNKTNKTIDIIFSKDLAEAILLKAKKKKLTPVKFITGIIKKEVNREIKFLNKAIKSNPKSKIKTKISSQSKKIKPMSKT